MSDEYQSPVSYTASPHSFNDTNSIDPSIRTAFTTPEESPVKPVLRPTQREGSISPLLLDQQLENVTNDNQYGGHDISIASFQDASRSTEALGARQTDCSGIEEAKILDITEEEQIDARISDVLESDSSSINATRAGQHRDQSPTQSNDLFNRSRHSTGAAYNIQASRFPRTESTTGATTTTTSSTSSSSSNSRATISGDGSLASCQQPGLCQRAESSSLDGHHESSNHGSSNHGDVRGGHEEARGLALGRAGWTLCESLSSTEQNETPDQGDRGQVLVWLAERGESHEGDQGAHGCLDGSARGLSDDEDETRLVSLRSSDRFISNRVAAPTIERWQTSTARERQAARISNEGSPIRTPHTRSMNRYAAIRHPQHYDVLHGLRATGLIHGRNSQQTSLPQTHWTVAGQPVTEGIMSTTNGRGGRITSGTNAPHYIANFLDTDEDHDATQEYQRLIAAALGLNLNNRMILIENQPPTTNNHNNSSADPNAWLTGALSTSHSLLNGVANYDNRDVSFTPHRVLDAPTLRDDYYSHLIAFSRNHCCLAVGLASRVFLWSENHSSANDFPELYLPNGRAAHVTSLSFSSTTGNRGVLAIGRSDGRLTLWNPSDGNQGYSYKFAIGVTFVSFRPQPFTRPSIQDTNITTATEELLVGDEAGVVYLFSLEWPSQDDRDLFGWSNKLILRTIMTCHTQQICGIAWSQEGQYFATGGNDNRLCIFNFRHIQKARQHTSLDAFPVDLVKDHTDPPPTHTHTATDYQRHVTTIVQGQEKRVFVCNAAVKAIAFAPFQCNLVAAGGGSNDRAIRFLHITTGATLATINVHAQVTALVWHPERKQIAATFGFAQPDHPFRIAVFAYPSCELLVRIPWPSRERALSAIPVPLTLPAEIDRSAGQSLRQTTGLVIATSNASIKFHNVWPTRRQEVHQRTRSARTRDEESYVLGDCLTSELVRQHNIR